MHGWSGQALRISLAMLVAALLLWGGFTTWVLTADNYQRIYPDVLLTPNPIDWRMIEGEGGLIDDHFVIDKPGQRARFLLAVSLYDPLDAQNYAHLEVKTSETRGYLPLSLAWSRARNFMSMPGVPMEPAGDGWFHMPLTHLPGWQDQIHFLAIEHFGALNEPLLIESIRLREHRPDFISLQTRLLKDWLSAQPWYQRSANNTLSSIYPVLVSPLIAAVCWIILSGLLFVLMSWRQARRNLPWLALPILIAWLALDLRWQMDLLLKASTAWRELGSLSIDQKRLSGPDHDLMEFLNRLDLDDSNITGRVFVFARNDYWRTRARYHLLPLSVRTRSDEFWNRPFANALEPGDLIILLDAPLLQVTRGDPEDSVTISNTRVEGSAVLALGLLSHNAYQAFLVDGRSEN